MEQLPDLKQFHNDFSYIQATADQLIKDFGYYGIDLEFRLEEGQGTPYEILYDQVHVVVEDLIDYHYLKLLPVLYRIDLSEQEIEKNHHLNPDMRMSESMTHLILARELRKVVLRRYFSSVQSTDVQSIESPEN